jgi:hypothetical protein
MCRCMHATANTHSLISAHGPKLSAHTAFPPLHIHLHTRPQELHELQAVASPEQLATNRTLCALRGARHPVRLCPYSFGLLSRFLHANGLMLTLALLNEHLKIDVVDGPPRTPGEDGGLEDEGLLVSACGVGGGWVEGVIVEWRMKRHLPSSLRTQ